MGTLNPTHSLTARGSLAVVNVLERIVSEVTYNALMGTLEPTHSRIHNTTITFAGECA